MGSEQQKAEALRALEYSCFTSGTTSPGNNVTPRQSSYKGRRGSVTDSGWGNFNSNVNSHICLYMLLSLLKMCGTTMIFAKNLV